MEYSYNCDIQPAIRRTKGEELPMSPNGALARQLRTVEQQQIQSSGLPKGEDCVTVGRLLRDSIVVGSVFLSLPAMARCHRYHRWYYPWPQSCKTVVVSPAPPLLAKRDRGVVTNNERVIGDIPLSSLNKEELTPYKPVTDEEAHTLGIEALKFKMGVEK